ncbi:MAG: Spy/CpxP family protein refolding chaperone [Bacteroidales bacterium]
MNFITRTRFLVIIIIVQSLLIVSILVTIGYQYYSFNRQRNVPMAPPMGGPQQPGDFVARALDLTPEQRENFRLLRDKFHESFDTLEFQAQQISGQLMEEITKDSIDNKMVDSLVDRFGEVQKLQKRLTIEHLAEVKTYCSHDQQFRFNRFVRQMNEFQQNRHRNVERMRRGQNRGPRNNNRNQN